MKKQNLDFKVALHWNSLLYNFELVEKNVDLLDFAILDIDLLSILKGINSDHGITQVMHCVMLLSFLKKAFVISLFCC